MWGRFMRVFKTKPFDRFARQADIDDASLLDAVDRAERGLLGADLGSGVIKQRIARRGEGRSGGVRAVILFKMGDRAFFVYGFLKSDMANISSKELRAFKKLEAIELGWTEAQLANAVKAGVYIEVNPKEESHGKRL